MMFKKIQRYHMNEGPASLLTLELLDNEARKPGRSIITHDDLDPVRRLCVLTTHTPRARRPRQVPDGTCRPGTGPARSL